MRVLLGPRITGARTFSSRARERANPAEVEGNGRRHKWKKKVALLYNLIPHLAPPQRLQLDLSGEGLEDGAEGLEEAEEVYLHARERGLQGPKAGARLPLHLEP